MPIKNLIKMGAASLLMKSTLVTKFSCAELYKIIQDMSDTMHEKGGVGIAAPQIGYNKRIIMFGFVENHRYPQEKSVPFTTLINPELEILSDELVNGWEGCLSVPGLRGLVPRYTKIRYMGYDAEGKEIIKIAEGFHARIVQHEYDHIEGILYPHRIKDLRNFGFEDILLEKIYNDSQFTVID